MGILWAQAEACARAFCIPSHVLNRLVDMNYL